MPEAKRYEDAIAQRIEKDTEAEARKIISEAKKEAKRIIEEARESAKEKKERIIENKLGELQHRKETEIAVIRADAKKRAMKVRSRLVDETFSQAFEEAMNLPRREYEAMLKKLIIQGASSMGSKEVLVKVHEGDGDIFVPSYLAGIERELSKRKIEVRLKLSKERIGAPGIVMESGNGKVALDMRIEELLRDAKGELSPEVEKILFRR